jgi:hypothetical protein
MTLRDLSDFQDFMFRNYVRSVMLFATLPYYLADERRRNRPGQRTSERPRDHRIQDVRWLR